jgi:hypothetical protein
LSGPDAEEVLFAFPFDGHARHAGTQEFAAPIVTAMAFASDITVLDGVAIDAVVRAGVVIADVDRLSASTAGAVAFGPTVHRLRAFV